MSTADLVEKLKGLAKAYRLAQEAEAVRSRPQGRELRLGQLIAELHKLAKQLPLDQNTQREIEDWLEGCRSALESRKAMVKQTFGHELDALLQQRGISLQGQHPNLKAGLYSIELNLDRWIARIWYGPKHELLGEAPLTPSAVAKTIDDINRKLTSRPFRDELFLTTLHAAYQAALGSLNRADGDPVPILTVLKEFVFSIQSKTFLADPRRENFTGYGRAFFSYDLFRLRQRILSGKELHLHIAPRAKTTKREDFLWIPSDEHGNGSCYSDLSFKEVSS
jgi:hypothetical protein